MNEARKEAIKVLTNLFDKDSRLFIVQKHMSKSGMLRRLRLYHINTNAEWPVLDVTSYVNDVLGWGMNADGLKVTGCGMDMHFHTTYSLGCDLWGFSSDRDKGGYKIKPISL